MSWGQDSHSDSRTTFRFDGNHLVTVQNMSDIEYPSIDLNIIQVGMLSYNFFNNFEPTDGVDIRQENCFYVQLRHIRDMFWTVVESQCFYSSENECCSQDMKSAEHGLFQRDGECAHARCASVHLFSGVNFTCARHQKKQAVPE